MIVRVVFCIRINTNQTGCLTKPLSLHYKWIIQYALPRPNHEMAKPTVTDRKQKLWMQNERKISNYNDIVYNYKLRFHVRFPT